MLLNEKTDLFCDNDILLYNGIESDKDWLPGLLAQWLDVTGFCVH